MGVAPRYLDDIQAVIPQGINVAINGLAFDRDIVGLQIGLDLIGCNCVFLVRVFEQVLEDAGVFKRDKQGKEAFARFVEQLG